MKQFFQTIKDSAYSPRFYQELPKQNASFSVTYFIKFIFMISCVVAVVLVVTGIGQCSWDEAQLEHVRQRIEETFPHELIVTMQHGKISTNVKEPYAILLPEEFRQAALEHQRAAQLAYPLENLLVIDTTKPIELDDFAKKKTVIILAKNEIGAYNANQGKAEIRSLAGLNKISGSLTHDSFRALVEEWWKPLQKALSIVVVVFLGLLPFIVTLGLFVGYGVYLVFGAIVVWLAGQLMRNPRTYGQSYQTGLHLLTLPIMISFVLPSVFRVPFRFSVLLFVMACLNFRSMSAWKKEA